MTPEIPGETPPFTAIEFPLPATPEVLEEWIERWSEGEPLHALREALARPGEDREGAHALLAADALLTSWAEAAALGADSEAQLRDQIRAIRALGAGE
jgi:hypothetical protein